MSPGQEGNPRRGVRQFGFSLGSLLGLLAVVGILVAVAIPADSLYVPRSKLKGAAAQAEACKSRVAEFVVRSGRLPQDANEAGCDTSPSEYTTSTAVVDGQVRVTIRNVAEGVDGRFLALQPLDAEGMPVRGRAPVARWRCGTDADLRGWLIGAFPRDCRQPPR